MIEITQLHNKTKITYIVVWWCSGLTIFDMEKHEYIPL